MLKHLASGGMADVLLGRSDGIEGFERHVVLKRIRAEYARDQRFVRMFLDEARVAATLHHQHVVQVHDIGQSDGEYFIAMEYIHGEDVRTILSSSARSRAHVPLGHAVAIVSAAAACLHYAHERCGSDKQPLDIVHRDVSPSNILVGYDGSIKVVDFGIAKASMSQETRSGSLKGKISYMSPEQCRGIAVDRRSDVFALGVVLYELATTTRLFKGDNDYLVMEQIVTGRISPPKLRRPSLPDELSNIILRALATDRDRRYASADELRVALEQFASNAGLTASTSTIAAYMRKQFGERPEPWLELIPPMVGSLDNLPTEAVEELSNASWTEAPRAEGSQFRSTPIPRIPAPPPLANHLGGRITVRASPPSRIVAPQPLPSQPLPTESKLGWESQPRPPSPRRFKLPLAAACVAAAAILSVAIWRLAGPGTTAAPTTAIVPPAQSMPATVSPSEPAPVEPPRIVINGAANASAATPAITAGTAEATARRLRSAAPAPAAAAATSRPAIKPAIEAPPPRSPKPERPVAAASLGAPGRAGDAEPAAGDSRREVTAPAPPPAPAIKLPPIASDAAALPLVPAAPQTVTAATLDANRIAGDKRIGPDEFTMTAMSRSGEDKLVGIYKVCIAAEGSVTGVSQLKSTGFAAYDAKILNTIHKDWRYRPFVINGKATAVCTTLRFMYSQK